MRQATLFLLVFVCLAVLPAPVVRAQSRDSIDISLRARAFQPGELVVVDLKLPAEVPAVEVQLFGRATAAARVAPREWQALVGIDLDQPTGEYTLLAVSSGGDARGSRELTVAPKQFPVRTLRVNPDFVNPPQAVLARISEESALLQRVYASSASERLWNAAWTRPVPHKANSRFGSRSVFNGEPRNPHGGTDFLSPAGTPIRAPNAGRVLVARDLYFSGRIVIIDHGLGMFSQLAHMSRIDVAEGDVVHSGQVVGLVGASGRVTGAHLHWGIRLGEARVDPLAIFALLAKDAP